MKLSSCQLVRARACALACRLAMGLLLLATPGCRNDASMRDAYIRELRMHENQIYELKDYMAEYQELLRRERHENAKLRQQLTADDADEQEPALRPAEDDRQRSLLDRPRRPERVEPRERADAGLPEIDIGEPALPEIDIGEPLPEGVPPGQGAGGGASYLPGHGAIRQASARSHVDGVANEDIAAIFAVPPPPVERARSCALYAEQMPVESTPHHDAPPIGLMAIVEPLTDGGAAGEFAGEVSLMLVDPIADEENWEIARWDYTPEEVEAAWRDTSRRVLDLPVALPASTPLGRPLELWVRLIPLERDHKILSHTVIELADPVRLVGVPVTGGEARFSAPGSIASSGWSAADEFRPTDPRETEKRSKTWQAATMLPPMAVARAEAKPAKPRGARQGERSASAAPAWSPLR